MFTMVAAVLNLAGNRPDGGAVDAAVAADEKCHHFEQGFPELVAVTVRSSGEPMCSTAPVPMRHWGRMPALGHTARQAARTCSPHANTQNDVVVVVVVVEDDP